MRTEIFRNFLDGVEGSPSGGGGAVSGRMELCPEKALVKTLRNRICFNDGRSDS